MYMVACGWRHTIAVAQSGNIYTFGWGKYGQLGHGDFADHLVPAQVQALKDKKIEAVCLDSCLFLLALHFHLHEIYPFLCKLVSDVIWVGVSDIRRMAAYFCTRHGWAAVWLGLEQGESQSLFRFMLSLPLLSSLLKRLHQFRVVTWSPFHRSDG